MNEGPAATLAEMRALLRDLPGPDLEAGTAAALREAQLTKPAGALGRLEEIALWLATWQGRHPPTALHPRTAVFAGNHGVAAQGVSAYPAAVTAQMSRRSGGSRQPETAKESGPPRGSSRGFRAGGGPAISLVLPRT